MNVVIPSSKVTTSNLAYITWGTPLNIQYVDRNVVQIKGNRHDVEQLLEELDI